MRYAVVRGSGLSDLDAFFFVFAELILSSRASNL